MYVQRKHNWNRHFERIGVKGEEGAEGVGGRKCGEHPCGCRRFEHSTYVCLKVGQSVGKEVSWGVGVWGGGSV
eukprot:363536-Chlamydomonas_euryale.AAC.3